MQDSSQMEPFLADLVIPIALHRLVETETEFFEDVLLTDFERLVEFLNKNCYEGFEATENIPKALLTFDDGNLSDYDLAFPTLQNASSIGCFFVPTSFIGKTNHLTIKNIREMDEHGMIFGSHSHTHVDLSVKSPTVVQHELTISKDILEGITGRNVDCLSLPYGRFNDMVLAVAESVGFKYCFGSFPGRTTFDKFLVPRNSLHSLNSKGDFNRFVKTSFEGKKNTFQIVSKELLKKVIGHKNYLSLRKCLLERR